MGDANPWVQDVAEVAEDAEHAEPSDFVSSDLDHAVFSSAVLVSLPGTVSS